MTIREGSRRSPLFTRFTEEGKGEARITPQWLSFDVTTLKVEVTGEPAYTPSETTLDYATVFEFYSR